MKKRFIKISKISLILVLLVILAGSLVRMTGSGMGCPDWPKCFGYLIPPTNISEIEWSPNKSYKKGIILRNNGKLIVSKSDFISSNQINFSNWKNYTKHNYSDFDATKTWIEFINRLLGAIAGLATLIMFVFSFSYWNKKNILILNSLLIIIGMGFQAWLGKLVVDSNLAPYKITVHMLMALVIISLIIYSIFKTQKNLKDEIIRDSFVKNLVSFTVLISLIQIVIGTQVREFIDLQYEIYGPNNKDKWLNAPNFYFYFHRTFSILIILLNFGLYYLIKLRNYSSIIIRKISFIIFLEIVVGIVMYYIDFPFLSQPIHLLLATILFSYQYYWMLHFKRTY
ncbi:COX15/CtaA family protein [Flavobacteriaceae bacterium]|nr:COX15/CtaA family protein [Flavobacteriaceae bacterium]